MTTDKTMRNDNNISQINLWKVTSYLENSFPGCSHLDPFRNKAIAVCDFLVLCQGFQWLWWGGKWRRSQKILGCLHILVFKPIIVCCVVLDHFSHPRDLSLLVCIRRRSSSVNRWNFYVLDNIILIQIDMKHHWDACTLVEPFEQFHYWYEAIRSHVKQFHSNRSAFRFHIKAFRSHLKPSIPSISPLLEIFRS